jgi:hypothetical protein
VSFMSAAVMVSKLMRRVGFPIRVNDLEPLGDFMKALYLVPIVFYSFSVKVRAEHFQDRVIGLGFASCFSMISCGIG